MSKKPDYTVLLLVALGLVGILTISFATTRGIGLDRDSATYIGAARNLLAGRGLTVLSGTGESVPMPDHPPLFPILVALVGLLGLEPIRGARLLNAVMFGATIVLVGVTIYRHTESRYAALLGAFLTLASEDMLTIHSVAMSEPAFLFFTFLAIMLLARYVENPKFLLPASAAAALAFLTRYPGLALVVTGLITIWSLGDVKSLQRRATQAALFGAASILPTAVFLLRNFLLTGSSTGRRFVVHPITLEKIQVGLENVVRWLVPAPIPLALLSGLVVAAVAGAVVIARVGAREKGDYQTASREQRLAALPPLLAIYATAYTAFLIVSISFFDAHTPLTSRVLLPLHVTCLMLAIGFASRMMRDAGRRRALAAMIAVFGIAFGFSNIVRATVTVVGHHRQGLGLTSRAWRKSETIAAVKALDRQTQIYSNGPDAVYLLAGRPAHDLPKKVNPQTDLVNSDYDVQLMAMEHEIAHGHAVLVYFKAFDRTYLPAEGELRERLDLRALQARPDGTIYTK